jgi:rRNA maturation endonuclease Nob1
MNYQIFELLCRACGESVTRRLLQFDELPSCRKCGGQTIVANVTTIENEVKQNGNSKKV